MTGLEWFDSTVPHGPAEISQTVKDRVRNLAKERGYEGAKEAVFGVTGPSSYLAAVKDKSIDERVMVISQRQKSPERIIAIRHLVAHIIGDGIASIEEIVSR